MYNIYTGAEHQVNLEAKNLENAGKNLTIAIELYKSGAINEIEFRDIQRKALEAENRLLIAEYTTKIAELSLKQISGSLKF
jgi:outer membrane protein TolC